MSSLIRAAQTLFTVGNHGRTRRFLAALCDPATCQRHMLRRTLHANAETEYGRRHRFAAIREPAHFQQQLPITTFEDYRSDIERIADGRPRVLTREPVRYFALSSGSSSAEKWIPYTRSLLGQFQQAIAPWLSTLFRAHPGARAGPAYWSITPLTPAHDPGSAPRASSIPIGFDEDSAYVGGLFKRLVDLTLAVPAELRLVSDMSAFRYLTLLTLLRTRTLALISVWHPSFLTLLLAAARTHWPALLRDIHDGTLTPPGACPDPVRTILGRRMRRDPARARELEQSGPANPARFWPRLALISTWTDAHAAAGARELQALFPSTPLQAKGLLATEGITSFPLSLGEATHHPLAVTSHFLEFLADDGRAHLAHQLETGAAYTVLLTTAGGLYRYQTGDRILVTGRLFETPTIRFLGKADQTCDLRGEKLNALFVAQCLAALHESLPPPSPPAPPFSMLAPDLSDGTPAYTLFIEPSPGIPLPDGLAEALDRLLSRNPHYAYCRSLGQLAPARLFIIAADAGATYLEVCVQQGQRLGNIKPTPLHRGTFWADRFRGHYLAASVAAPS